MADDLTNRAKMTQQRLAAAIREPRVELDHDGAWQLLIATILAARCTDKLVNTVTPALFERFPTPRELGEAPLAEVEVLVKSTGFFRNKAKAIVAASKMVAERFGGEVPRTMKKALELPGVARKTANVVLGSAYRISSGIIVDVHVARVAKRLGLTAHKEPDKVERDLCGLFARRSWIDMGHRLVLHGRYVCTSRHPDCPGCPLNELCPSAEQAATGRWKARAAREQATVSSRGEE